MCRRTRRPVPARSPRPRRSLACASELIDVDIERIDPPAERLDLAGARHAQLSEGAMHAGAKNLFEIFEGVHRFIAYFAHAGIQSFLHAAQRARSEEHTSEL